ncbi:MAG TPA: CCA tRNA nucleotidyltransferase [Gemmataceae bacterium]|nr:CCA tRNA nucleotidyltransferase [Gemmataceae bacterium]
MTEREFAIDVVKRLRAAGHEALWAGGCVRDQLLGLEPTDYDVATDAAPEQVRRLFRHTVAVGASFGVIEVLGPRQPKGPPLSVEVATFRKDLVYSDGRRPDAVVFSSAREDALRRDFTINGMFFDPLTDQLIDYVGGQDDLRARLLRAIGDAPTRFSEDKLRMFRAVRFATRFDLRIEPATQQAILAMAPQIGVVSVERIAKELQGILIARGRARGVALLDEVGLVKPILPELLEMKDLPYGPPGAATGDLWQHTLIVLDLLGPGPSFPLAFAALLHDVGKRRALGRTPNRYTFHGHEHIGCRMASEIGHRLKLSNAERERIEWLVDKHQQLCDARRMRTSKLKKLLANPGIEELLALHRADAEASGRSTDHVTYCEQLLREWSEVDLNPPPLLTGHDLARMGLEPGPLFKELLDAVREAQLDGTITGPKQAMELIERLLRERRGMANDENPSKDQ